jgi:hypothetical protein
MRKLLTITALVLVAAIVAVPAFAAVQNVRVSGSVDSTYLHRKNFDFGVPTTACGTGDCGDLEQSIFFTQTILRVDADLTDQVAATVALINERPWAQDGAHDFDFNSQVDDADSASTVKIFQAYVTLREMLYSPLTLIVGRQSFSYGNSLIINSAGTNNSAPGDSGLNGVAADLTKMTAMDAIRAILDYNPLTIDVVYSQIEDTTASTNQTHDRDHVLAGINANYQLGDDMGSVVEAYFWKKVDKSQDSNTFGDAGKADEVYTVGGRVSTNPLEGWNIQVENAYQKGSKRHDAGFDQKRSAWIVQFIANWQIPAFDEYNPTGQYVYTKATGDSHENTGDADGHDQYTGWDPMFENQGSGKIYNALFNLTNFEIHELTFGFNPMEDVLAKLSVAGVWLERDTNGTVANNFTTVQPTGGSVTHSTSKADENTYLGKEVDLELIYDYTEDVQIGGNFGWFFPGSVFRSPNDQTAKQAIVHMNVNF